MEFTCKAVSGFLQNQGVKCYFMSKFEAFAYLVDDLEPEIVLVHESMLGDVNDELQKCHFKEFEKIVISQGSEYEKKINEPFDPSEIYSELVQILATEKKSS